MPDRTLGILLFPDGEELDFAGPWELFGLWRALGGGPRCVTIGRDGDPVRARHGLQVCPDVSMEDTPPLSYLLVPGGPGAEPAAQDPHTLQFVAQQAKTVDALLSVCTGVRVLHAAGLLAGRSVTTHHTALDDVRSWNGVTAVDDERYVRDGALWTAAGISAGLDMALAFIAAEAGPGVAKRVQREAEYRPVDPARGGGTDTNGPCV